MIYGECRATFSRAARRIHLKNYNIIYIYIEYQFPFEIIFKHETFPAITNNNADANQNGNIPRMEKSAQPFLFVSCYFLCPTSTGRGG